MRLFIHFFHCFIIIFFNIELSTDEFFAKAKRTRKSSGKSKSKNEHSNRSADKAKNEHSSRSTSKDKAKNGNSSRSASKDKTKNRHSSSRSAKEGKAKKDDDTGTDKPKKQPDNDRSRDRNKSGNKSDKENTSGKGRQKSKERNKKTTTVLWETSKEGHKGPIENNPTRKTEKAKDGKSKKSLTNEPRPKACSVQIPKLTPNTLAENRPVAAATSLSISRVEVRQGEKSKKATSAPSISGKTSSSSAVGGVRPALEIKLCPKPVAARSSAPKPISKATITPVVNLKETVAKEGKTSLDRSSNINNLNQKKAPSSPKYPRSKIVLVLKSSDLTSDSSCSGEFNFMLMLGDTIFLFSIKRDYRESIGSF